MNAGKEAAERPSVFDRIRDMYPSFSKQQRAIADFILGQGLQVAFKSCNQIAQDSATSPATVIRFTQNLGYPKYEDFGEELHRMLLRGHRPMSKLREAIEATDDQEVTLERGCAFEIESIADLVRQQQETILRDAVLLLSGARRIYVTGARSAYSLAHYAGFLLRELVNTVQYFPSGAEDAYERLEHATRADVLLVVTFRRYARSSYKLAQFASERGVRVLALTDDPVAPVTAFAKVSLFAPSKMPFFSYVAPMAVLDTLIWGFARERSADIGAVLEERQRMLLEQQVFI